MQGRAFTALIGTGAAVALAGIWFLPLSNAPGTRAAAAAPVVREDPREPLFGCRVTDGDTLRCGSERIRLLGIDAPELPGHCRAGRMCAAGDPVASTESLRAALTGDLRIVRVATDRYGRTIALVSGAKGDLSCWQLRRGQAIYRDDWDNGGRVRRLCRDAARRVAG